MKRALQPLLLALLALFVVACASQQMGARVPMHPRTPTPGLFLTQHEQDVDPLVPLEGVKASVEMIDSMAKVTLAQRYKNPLSTPVTVNYIFPMDEQAAITDFSAEFSNGRRLIGLIKAKEQAKQEFDEAVESGHSAVLLEQHSSDVFQVNVGNLEKGEEVTISITYLTTVPLESSNQYRFTLPTLVAPRHGGSPDAEPSASDKAAAKYKLELDLEARMGTTVVSATSDTHDLKTRPGKLPSQYYVSTEGEVDGDFVILIQVEDVSPNEKSSIVVENSLVKKSNEGKRGVKAGGSSTTTKPSSSTQKPKTPRTVQPDDHEDSILNGTRPSKKPENLDHLSGKAVYINIKPADFVASATTNDDNANDEVEPDEANTEVWFVVDVSGSMVGEKMEDTIGALKAAMNQLLDRDSLIFFNIVPFSNEFRSLFDIPKALTQETYNQAIEYVSSLQAGGGTELLEPLKHVFGSASVARRRVIILTDGLIGNNKDVFNLIKEQKTNNTAVFSIGIGAGVSHSLVNGLALHGGGVAEYVAPGERVTEKVARQLSRSLSSGDAEILTLSYFDQQGRPVLTGVTQTPSTLPPLYSESDVRAFALLPESVAAIEISGSASLRKVRIDLTRSATVTSDIIHKMAAKSRIRELELALVAQQDAAEGNKVDIKEIQQHVIQLSTYFHLMSSLTSFVAVDPTATAETPSIPISVPVKHERGGVHSKLRMMTAGIPPLRDIDGVPQVDDDIPYVLNFEELAKEAGTKANLTEALENTDVDPIDPEIKEKIESGNVTGEAKEDDQTPKTIPDNEDDSDGFFWLADFLVSMFSWVHYLIHNILGKLVVDDL